MATSSYRKAVLPVMWQAPASGPSAADKACSPLDLLASVCPILSHRCTNGMSRQILTCAQEPQHPSDGGNGAEANGAGNDDADDELANFVENTWNPRSPYSVRLDLPQTLLNR